MVKSGLEAVAISQVLVHPDGFERLQNLAHLRPSFEHPGLRLERPQAFVNMWGISGMRQHPCAYLACEGVLRRSHRASVDGIMLTVERRSLYRRNGSMLRERSQDGVRLKGSDPNEWFEGE